MSPVKDADPDAVGLDAAFGAAMGTPPRPREPAAPADVDPDAPHGRDADGNALAPFGLTRDGKPRKNNAGRKPGTDDRARVDPARPASSAGGSSAGSSSPAPHDYTKPLAELSDTVWLGISALGRGGSAIPIVGRWIPERRVAAQAVVFRSYRGNLVSALNLAAQHNARAARLAETVEQGDLTWALTVGLMVMPFITTSAAIWQGDAAMAKAELPTIAELAARNDKQLDAYLASLSAQLEQLAAEAGELIAEASAAADAGDVAEQLEAARLAGIL